MRKNRIYNYKFNYLFIITHYYKIYYNFLTIKTII